MLKLRQKFLDIALVMFVLLGIGASIFIGGKIFKTSFSLNRISSDISYLEGIAERSAPGHEWSEELMDEYKALQNERKSLYNSSDTLVQWFSTANKPVQWIVIFVVLFLWSAVFVLILSFAKAIKNRICKTFRRQK